LITSLQEIVRNRWYTMPSTTEIKEDSYIRHLPYSTVRYLSSHLDPDQLWKKFVVHVPKKLDAQIFQERYSTMQVKLFEERGNKPNGSPTRSIIDDWGTQNARVKHLIKALTEGELYAAADYISVKVLKQDPVTRNTNASLLSFDSDSFQNLSLPSPGTNIDCNAEKKFPGSKDISDLTGKTGTDNNSTSIPGSEDIRSLHINSYDSFPSNDPFAAAIIKPPSRIHKDDIVLPVILPQEKMQEFTYKTLSQITNGFDDRVVLDGGRIIGSGGFGNVYLGIPSNGYKVAVKTLKVDQEEAMMIKQFQTELETLSKYRHENIVPFLGFSVDGREKCLVYQYMPNGSLEDRLCCLNKTEPLSWELRVKISQGTAEGIVYLNNNKLVHRDIKSANVLLDEDFSPKVGDFATVRVAPSGSGISSAVSTKLVIGTSAYMAPEAPRFDISAKLDSFAFGVVLLELLTGLPPLDSDRSESDLLSYIQENCDDDISDYLDEKAGDWDIKVANTLYHMSQKCVETRKKDRVLVSDILPELDILVETKLS
jgi:interleukin-1 receptor-associated kinase 4